MSTRLDGRSTDALRPLKIETRVQKNPEGSVMISSGVTRILVAASIDESLPPWLRGKGSGWVTAEYAMHPRANPHRQDRDGRRGKVDGRTTEIQRLIGRALRAAVDMKKLGERQIVIDCDVLDADGGTRTAAITGGFVALAMALDHLRRTGLAAGALRAQVAAISAGMVDGKAMLDLAYVEDSKADVDLNVVATGDGALVEVQGTAEGPPVPRAHFDTLIDLSLGAMPALMSAQKSALASIGIDLDLLRG
ncbi:MAG: ribonuclease PH [Deltaproteobacteria bacterium]|nr:ribonuclease PH [Deltaproteobacteria bacterium]